ncbi:MAG: 1-acyl-sn-glycerol-3-phosphate acyltransferase [Firmicutes bacterium]|nr:1-acyl-sn-glycerol-3-phosphate acyltransferase [Bacillota bacterium]
MYRFLVMILKFFVVLVAGLEVEGQENVPLEGGAIVAGTHTSMLDPVGIAIALKRPVHFMGKVELFKFPPLAWLFKRLHAFPVKRGLADREAIRIAQERVSQGNVLGIFPEGTRNNSAEDLLPLQGGTALIAIKTGVPVIPAVVSGFKPMRFRRAVKVTFGKPIDLGGPRKANKAEVEEGTKVISAEFSSLLSRNN